MPLTESAAQIALALWMVALTLLLSATTYRICRLMILDKIGEVPRDAFFGWLADHPSRFCVWLTTLLTCPFCVSVWVSGALVIAVDNPTGWLWDASVPLPVLEWGASAAGALLFWARIDDED